MKKVLFLVVVASFLLFGMSGIVFGQGVVQDPNMIVDTDIIKIPSDFTTLSYDSEFVYCAKINFNSACDSNYKVDYSYYLYLDNTQSDGAKLPLNASACSDSLDAIDTVDWWVLNLTSNGTLDIMVIVPSGADFDLGLADSAGNFVAHSANSTLGAAERIVYEKTSPSAEIWGLRVNRTAGSGSYFLTANFNGTGETGAQTSCRANKPTWGDKKGSAQKYKDTFAGLGADIPSTLGDNYYCVKEVAKGAGFPPPTIGRMYLNATCEKTLVTPTTYYDSIDFPVASNMGKVNIGLKQSDFKFSAPPGSNITISPYEDLSFWNLTNLLSPVKSAVADTATQAGRETLKTYAISYQVRSASSAAIFQQPTTITTTDILLFPWKSTFAIPATALAGFVEINASNGTNWGSRYIAYQTIPTIATFTVNNVKSATVTAGSVARLNAISTNYYGTIASTSLSFINWPETSTLSVRYPNGSTATATITPNQTLLILPPEAGAHSVNVTAPATPGTYTINLTIANTVGGGYFLQDAVTLVSTPSAVRIEGLSPIYTPGQTLNITAGVLDQAGVAVDISDLNLTIKDPASATLAVIGFGNTTLEPNRYRRALYTLPTNASIGTYSLSASIKDTANATYTGTFSFNVSAPVAGLSFDPSSISETVTNLDPILKTINVTNTGASAVNITAVTVSDTIKANVAADSILGTLLNASSSAMMRVIILANDTIPDGAYSGTVTLNSDGQVAILPVSFTVSLTPPSISLNSSISISVVTTERSYDLPFSNSGARRLQNVTAEEIEDSSNILRNVSTPAYVSGNSTSYFTLNFETLEAKNYTAKIRLSGTGAAASDSTISIRVIADFKSDIATAKTEITSLLDEIITMKDTNKINVGDLEERASALKASITQLESLYSSKKYDQAATLLADITAKAKDLRASVNALVTQKPTSSVCGDLVCGKEETASTCPKDCGAKTVTAGTSTTVVLTVIIIIIVIIVGIILALSIVPEETTPAAPVGY